MPRVHRSIRHGNVDALDASCAVKRVGVKPKSVGGWAAVGPVVSVRVRVRRFKAAMDARVRVSVRVWC